MNIFWSMLYSYKKNNHSGTILLNAYDAEFLTVKVGSKCSYYGSLKA